MSIASRRHILWRFGAWYLCWSGQLLWLGKNDLKSPKDSSSDLLVGGETVFYGSRNVVVAEVNFYVCFLHFFLYIAFQFCSFPLHIIHCILFLKKICSFLPLRLVFACILWNMIGILMQLVTCRWFLQKGWLFCTFTGTYVCCMKPEKLRRVSSMFFVRM